MYNKKKKTDSWDSLNRNCFKFKYIPVALWFTCCYAVSQGHDNSDVLRSELMNSPGWLGEGRELGTVEVNLTSHETKQHRETDQHQFAGRSDHRPPIQKPCAAIYHGRSSRFSITTCYCACALHWWRYLLRMRHSQRLLFCKSNEFVYLVLYHKYSLSERCPCSPVSSYSLIKLQVCQQKLIMLVLKYCNLQGG